MANYVFISSYKVQLYLFQCQVVGILVVFLFVNFKAVLIYQYHYILHFYYLVQFLYQNRNQNLHHCCLYQQKMASRTSPAENLFFLPSAILQGEGGVSLPALYSFLRNKYPSIECGDILCLYVLIKYISKHSSFQGTEAVVCMVLFCTRHGYKGMKQYICYVPTAGTSVTKRLIPI